NLTVPFLDTFATTNGIFTTDLDRDGRTADLLPGTNVRHLGRKIKSFEQLNRILTDFNNNSAGKLTPTGQALLAAGIFTAPHLRPHVARVKPVASVPETNPWPLQKLMQLDARIARRSKIKEKLYIDPSLDVFNVCNHTGLGSYGGLGGPFGSLNFDYVADPRG